MPQAIDGALRAISFAGANQPIVPGTGNQLRFVWTNAGADAPACVLLFSEDLDQDCYWIEELRLRGG